jgi:hypothetical protein
MMSYEDKASLAWGTFWLIFILTMAPFVLRLIVGLWGYYLSREYDVGPDPSQYKGRVFFCSNGRIHTMDNEPHYGPGKKDFDKKCDDIIHQRQN